MNGFRQTTKNVIVAIRLSRPISRAGSCKMRINNDNINKLIYILEEQGVKVKLFADDVKMYARIVNNVSMVQLQRAIRTP